MESWSHNGKEPACQHRRCKRREFDPWVGWIPWSRQWKPLQYSCLDNPMDRGAGWATVHEVTESRKPVSTHTHTHTHTHTRKARAGEELRDWLVQTCHVTDKDSRLQAEEVHLPVMEEISEHVCGKDWCHLGDLGLCSHRALINQPWRNGVPALTLYLSFISIIKTSHKPLVTASSLSSCHG